MEMRTVAAEGLVVLVLCSDLFLIFSSGNMYNAAVSGTEAAFSFEPNGRSRDVLSIPSSRFLSMRARRAQERYLKTVDLQLRLKNKTGLGIFSLVVALAILISVCFYKLPNFGDAFKKRELGRLLGADGRPFQCSDSGSDADGPLETGTMTQNQRSGEYISFARQRGDERNNTTVQGLIVLEHAYMFRPDDEEKRIALEHAYSSQPYGEQNNTAGKRSTEREHANSTEAGGGRKYAAVQGSIALEHAYAVQPDNAEDRTMTNTGKGFLRRPKCPSSSTAAAPSTRYIAVQQYVDPTSSSVSHSGRRYVIEGALVGSRGMLPKYPPDVKAKHKRVYELTAISTSSESDNKDPGSRSSGKTDDKGGSSTKKRKKRSSTGAGLDEPSGRELQATDRTAISAASASIMSTRLNVEGISNSGESAHIRASVVSAKAFEPNSQSSAGSSLVSDGYSNSGTTPLHIKNGDNNLRPSQSHRVPESAPRLSSDGDNDRPRKRAMKTKHIEGAPVKMRHEETPRLGGPCVVSCSDASPERSPIACPERGLSSRRSDSDAGELGDEWTENYAEKQCSQGIEASAPLVSFDFPSSADGASASHQDSSKTRSSGGSGSARTQVLFPSVDGLDGQNENGGSTASVSVTRTTLNFLIILLRCALDTAEQVLLEVRVTLRFSPATKRLRRLFKWYLSTATFLTLRVNTAKTVLSLTTGRSELEDAATKLRRAVESIQVFLEARPLHHIMEQAVSARNPSTNNSQGNETTSAPSFRMFPSCDRSLHTPERAERTNRSSVHTPETGEVAAGLSIQGMGLNAPQPEASTSGSSGSCRSNTLNPVRWHAMAEFRPKSLHVQGVECFVLTKILASLYNDDLELVNNPRIQERSRLDELLRLAMKTANVSAHLFEEAKHDKHSRFVWKYLLMAESSAWTIYFNLRHAAETLNALVRQEQQLQQLQDLLSAEQQLQQQQHQMQHESDQGPQSEAQQVQQQMQQQVLQEQHQQQVQQGLSLEDSASEERRYALLLMAHLRQLLGYMGAIITSGGNRSEVAREGLLHHLSRGDAFVEAGRAFLSTSRGVRGRMRAAMIDSLNVAALIMEETYLWLQRRSDNND